MSKSRKTNTFVIISLTIILILGMVFLYADEALLNFGIIRERRGDIKDAVWAYNLSARINPKNVTAQVKTIQNSISDKNIDIKIEKALESLPDSWEIYAASSNAYVMSGQISKAVEVVNQAKGSFASQKIRSFRPEMPNLQPAPGYYDRNIELSAVTEDSNACYISINDDDYIKYTQMIELPKGKSKVCAITVGQYGLVSDVRETTYNLGRISEPIEFKDKSVENNIRNYLSKPNGIIMTDDVMEVAYLDLTMYKDIRTLEDLRNIPNIKTLKLSNLQAKLSGCFENLEELETLSITGGISQENLEVISKNIHIKNLELIQCGLDNIIDLSSMQNLKNIDFSGNNIRSTKYINNALNLEGINLSFNKINDINDLGLVKNLKTMDLSANSINNIDKLSHLKNIECLDISFNEVENADVLSGLSSLKQLYLNHNKIRSIALISSLSNLTHLEIDDNAITDLPNFRNMNNLQYLSVKNNLIEDIAQINYLTNLSILDVSGNNITDISFLKDNKNLRQAYASDNPIRVTQNVLGNAEIIMN